MIKENLLSDYKAFIPKIQETLQRYLKRLSKRANGFIYSSAETFLVNCEECSACVVYDNYFVVAEVGCQWWDKDTPVLFECLVLSIGEHEKAGSFIDMLEHLKAYFGCKYISFGTQGVHIHALGRLLEDNGYLPCGGFYCKE